MKTRNTVKLIVAAAVLGLSTASAFAQTKLKWAHVYETTEPFHTESVWAAEEIKSAPMENLKSRCFPPRHLAKRRISTKV